MANVKIIPADPHRTKSKARIEETPKLRVAAYCRVSTDTDEQATSYETQVEHYTEYISNNPKWTLAGIYADDGISGTNTKNRTEFNRMIEACMAGEIDMVISKSISRFARNTLDCLKYIRQLKAQNIPVYFEKEGINTLDAKGEVLITIMASLAQQESQSLSQNVKLGLQYRYQQGKVQVNHNHFLGYTKDADGNLIIDPVQAETVKRIYREYLEGYSMDKIKAGLERDGILTGAGKTRWTPRPSTKSSVTRSTSVMPCFRKPTPPIFSARPESKTTASYRSIMWKVTMKPSFQKTSISEFRMSLYADAGLQQHRVAGNAPSAVTMSFPRWFSAVSAVNCSAGCTGTTEA